MKVTIERISRKQYEGEKGQYTRVGILTKEYGERWLSGYGTTTTDEWEDGDIVEIEVEDTGQYLNYKTKNKGPMSTDVGRSTEINSTVKNTITKLVDDVKQLQIQNKNLQSAVNKLNNITTEPKVEDPFTEEKKEEVPF